VTDSSPSESTGDLGKRIASGIAMAALAVGAVVLGGGPFALFWAAAAVGIFWEWSAIVAGGAVVVRVVGIASLIAAALAAGAGQISAASMALAAGMAAVAVWERWRPARLLPLISPPHPGDGRLAARETPAVPACAPSHRWWGAAGVAYAGVLSIAPVALRRDPEFGLLAILFLFAVVWSTDILGYFVGRSIGGPRLAPHVSPKKTWSGACGGVLGALAAGIAVVYIAGNTALLPAACVAFMLSISSQAGDLLESAVKRRFGVKDASHVIPGHGGLMDRLDGFIAASGVAALVGIVRGGLDAPARGLLLW
jgi:phosphatidate cytidylyltransferase